MQLLKKVQDKDIQPLILLWHTPAFMLEDNPQPQSSSGAQELPITTDSNADKGQRTNQTEDKGPIMHAQRCPRPAHHN